MEMIMETERLLLRTLFRTKKRTIGFPASKHATGNTVLGFGR